MRWRVTTPQVSGGGLFAGVANNCTITGNSCDSYGGGASSEPGPPGGVGPPYCILTNCIVYFNTAVYGENYIMSFLDHCCATPMADGAGNITNDPLLASTSHLSIGSPCRGAGNTNTAGVDIDGETWLIPPSIGCDEYHPGRAVGPSEMSIIPASTNIATSYPTAFSARITGAITASAWDFGDGTIVSNQPYALHTWSRPGDYVLGLRAYSDAHPEGILATAAVHVVAAPQHYVAADSTNPQPPYTSWATAATNIQDAVDAATMPGSVIVVSNGVYATGGRAVDQTLTNRLVVNKILAVRSVNGPRFTSIVGYQVSGTTNNEGAIRCVYLGNGATLSGFTLTNGATRLLGNVTQESGGGIWCEPFNAIVSNCFIVNCSAAWYGGGAAQGTLINCYLGGDSAGILGGGAYSASMTNCVVTGSSASEGGAAYGCGMVNCTLAGNSAWSTRGGASNCQLSNCIVYDNTAPSEPNYGIFFSLLNYCCTTPQPTNGFGNITNAPLFVDIANGNLRLQSNSPCINAGKNAYVTSAIDLDGNPRVVGGTVDIGAYEFQYPTSKISYAWLAQYGLPTDASADDIDSDGDGMNNWQEWICGTNPTDPLSVLRMLSPSISGTGITLAWLSEPGIEYIVERSANLTSLFVPLAIGIPGQPGITTYTDTSKLTGASAFYRVRITAP